MRPQEMIDTNAVEVCFFLGDGVMSEKLEEQRVKGTESRLMGADN